MVLLRSDHGGSGDHHTDPGLPAHFTAPFLAWGTGIARGADLCRLNPRLETPGPRSRPRYGGPALTPTR